MANKWVKLKSKSDVLYPKTQSTLLEWGGPNIERSFSPLDAALSDELSANRFAEMPNENFVFERSSDAGNTWTTYTAHGYNLVTSSTNVKNSNVVGSQSVNNWHRFTIDVRPGSSNNFYGEIRKFLFWISTNGATGCKVKIDGSTFANPDTFVKIVEAPISGWSGWNVINVNVTAGLGNNTFYKKLRFTFSQTGVNTSYDSNLIVSKMRVYCANCWFAPGNFALQNRPYYIVNGEQVQQYSIRFVAGRKLYGIASNADLANNSLKLNGKADTYYLNYQNLTNKPTLKLVACPYDAGVSNGAIANPYINTVFDGAVSSSIQLYSSELTVQSDSAGKVTIEPSMAPSIFAADTTTATVPGFSTNPYLRVYYGGKYNTGPRLKSGNGIHIQSDTSNNITISSTLDGITNLSNPSYTLYTMSTGIYRVSSSVTKLYYNGTSDTSVYVSLNLSQPAYLVVSHTKAGCEWMLYYQKTSGVAPSILWGYGSSSLGYYFENQFPAKTGQLVAGPPTSDIIGGICTGFSNNGSQKAVAINSVNRAYVDVGVNISFYSLSSVFGNGTGGLIRVNDTANNNRYLFIYGQTGTMTDGASVTWNYPTVITTTSASNFQFSFTEIGTFTPIEWQNNVIITNKTSTLCTIRNNCGNTCAFSFIGIARW